ncbi:RNA polymerase sigma factor [Rhodoplanes sp. TEM]|uniref:RNA polymerase sigma factor n=1 Tax=Rhodoplanes tepidamans TaxID=200616 RepID=A0ABT5JD74_RHOTP|nr:MULTISPECIES: RNA polymerase sigma factor [Rhodoplanes]MDC7787650.1 RNA polymerase sigma factor [Rhodoplanes tepidamans]MDC7987963.1 RNA polymerase sigma factor [Rhodoplanes sp. TEM]MDQ0355220.1 RNA polymerase sigma-70 factor (ECF subfamily) [Rhodoplanes tepidamans]
MEKRPAVARLLEAFASERARLEALVDRRLRSAATTADVMQESWLKLAGLAGDVSVDNPGAFVRSVARNAATDHLRKERRRSVIDEEVRDLLWDGADAHSPERIMIGRQALAAFAEALAGLPPQSRRIFLMNRFEGKSHREIARELGISEPAVYYHVRRVLEHLAVLREHLPD